MSGQAVGARGDVSDGLVFDEGLWPLVVLRLPTRFTPACMQGIIDGYERTYARKERFASLTDCSSTVRFPGAVERKMLAEWLGQPGRTENEKLYTVGAAIVLTSGPMRALMSAIRWINPPTSPQVWPATEAEAFEWCCEQLVNAGIPLTHDLEAARAEHQRSRAAAARRT